VRTRFSARARKTAPGAGALPNCRGIHEPGWDGRGAKHGRKNYRRKNLATASVRVRTCQLLVDAADVSVDGFVADRQFLGDFLVHQALAQQVQHLLFALGEIFRVGVGGGRRGALEGLDDLAGRMCMVMGEPPDCTSLIAVRQFPAWGVRLSR